MVLDVEHAGLVDALSRNLCFSIRSLGVLGTLTQLVVAQHHALRQVGAPLRSNVAEPQVGPGHNVQLDVVLAER